MISHDIAREPSFRFGATIIPIFDKHVAMREQIENAQNIQPKVNHPIPLSKVLIFGGITLDDFGDNEDEMVQGLSSRSTMRDSLHCTVLHFTNSNRTPVVTNSSNLSEESKDAAKG